MQPLSHRVAEPPEQNRPPALFDELTGKIIGCAIEVHRQLGPGLLGSVYECALAAEFDHAKLAHQRQVVVPIHYREKIIGEHKIDLIVQNRVVVELKSVERYDRIFEAQILTYLRITGLKTGLLINFNSRLLHDGIRRFAL